MSGIFISYRRSDAGGYSGRLYEALARRFGRQRVFMDIDTLEAGLDFDQALDQAVATCDVLLALIGPGWLRAVDADGNRRLDNPDDLVRLEIRTALSRDDIRVIPVLVGNASMPGADALPVDLKPLARRHAFEISEARWDYDVRRLIQGLEQIVKPRRRVAASRLTRGRGAPLVAGLVVVAGLTLLGFNLLGDGNGNDGNGDENPWVTATATETISPTATTAPGGQNGDNTPEPPTTAPGGQNGDNTPEPPTATATIEPTEVPDSDGPTADELPQPGDSAVVAESGINLREFPSVSSESLTILDSGEVVLLQNGPIEADEYLFWEVVVESTGETGYVAEDFLDFSP